MTKKLLIFSCLCLLLANAVSSETKPERSEMPPLRLALVAVVPHADDSATVGFADRVHTQVSGVVPTVTRDAIQTILKEKTFQQNTLGLCSSVKELTPAHYLLEVKATPESHNSFYVKITMMDVQTAKEVPGVVADGDIPVDGKAQGVQDLVRQLISRMKRAGICPDEQALDDKDKSVPSKADTGVQPPTTEGKGNVGRDVETRTGDSGNSSQDALTGEPGERAYRRPSQPITVTASPSNPQTDGIVIVNPSVEGSGRPQFNFLVGDYPLLEGANTTRQQDTWETTVSAHVGDELSGIIYYHNGKTDSLASNTRVKLNVPEHTSRGVAVVTATISADNAEPVNATRAQGRLIGEKGLVIKVGRDARLTYVPGYTRLFFREGKSDMKRCQLPRGQSGDEIIEAQGLNIGDIKGCWEYTGFVSFRLRVDPIR